GDSAYYCSIPAVLILSHPFRNTVSLFRGCHNQQAPFTGEAERVKAKYFTHPPYRLLKGNRCLVNLDATSRHCCKLIEHRCKPASCEVSHEMYRARHPSNRFYQVVQARTV